MRKQKPLEESIIKEISITYYFESIKESRVVIKKRYSYDSGIFK